MIEAAVLVVVAILAFVVWALAPGGRRARPGTENNWPIFHTFDGRLRGLTKTLSLADGNPLEIMRPTEEIPTPELLKAMQGD